MEKAYRWYFGLGKSYDKSRYAEFWDILGRAEMFEGINEHWELEELAISPKYQRRGVGTMLLSWGMAQATKHRMPIVLAASADGEYLYRKQGFQEYGRVEFPGIDFSWAAMVWYPTSLDSHRTFIDQVKR